MIANTQFCEIVWPEKPVLSNPEKMAKAKSIVEMLCKLGIVTYWQESQGGYAHMAFHYDINGVEVRYLPHWGFYTVGMLDFSLPQKEQDILETVAAYKVLQEKGLKTTR